MAADFAPILAAAADGATIVTANARTQRRLLQLYEAGARQEARAWPTPAILTWSAWLDGLWNDYLLLPEANPPLRLNGWQAQHVWERALSGSVSGKGLLAPQAAADLAATAWDLLHEYRVERWGSLASTPEAAVFKAWADCFAATCAGSNWVDAARLPELLAAAVKEKLLAVAGRFLFFGFDKFTPRQLRLLEALRQCGCACEPVEVVSVPEATNIVRVGCNDAAAEIETAARWARQRLEANPAASIGIVVPGLGQRRERIERIFAEVLAPASLVEGAGAARVFELSLGRPLAAYPMVHAALDLLRWLAGPLSSANAGALLRSPFLGGGETEASSRALLEAEMRRRCGINVTLAEVLRLARGRDKDGKPRPHYCGQFAQLLGAARRKLDVNPKAPSAWNRNFAAMLEAAGWPGERPLDSSDYQTWQAVHELLRSFATLDVALSELALAEAVEQLAAYAAAEIFQPENVGAPVQVLGHLETSGSRFDYLWVMGLDDESWPPRGTPHPLLPLPLQKSYGMPHASIAEDLQFARQVTQRLRRSAGEVVFSYPKVDGDRPLRPSPLLADVAECPPEAVVPQSGDTWVAAIHACADVVENVPEEPAADLDNSTSRAAKLFELQASCPFRAFAELRLGAQPLETPAPGLDARQRGKLVHRALQYIWEELKNSENLRALTPEAQQALVKRCVERTLADKRVAAPDLWAERFAAVERDRLVQLLCGWQAVERQRAAFEVVALEYEQQAEIGGVQLNIRIDRIDRTADDDRIILDYKTGRPTRKLSDAWDGDRPDEPQLPLYAVVTPGELAALSFAHVRLGSEGKFRGEAEADDLLPGVSAAGVPLAQNLEQRRAALTALAEAFAAGDAAISPKYGDKTCEKCELHSLCRISLPCTVPDDAEDELE